MAGDAGAPIVTVQCATGLGVVLAAGAGEALREVESLDLRSL